MDHIRDTSYNSVQYNTLSQYCVWLNKSKTKIQQLLQANKKENINVASLAFSEEVHCGFLLQKISDAVSIAMWWYHVGWAIEYLLYFKEKWIKYKKNYSPFCA